MEELWAGASTLQEDRENSARKRTREVTRVRGDAVRDDTHEAERGGGRGPGLGLGVQERRSGHGYVRIGRGKWWRS